MPPAALRPWLECVWTREGAGGPPARILPDGCIDVVWSSEFGTRVVGANTTAFMTQVAAGERLIGARMWPGVAPALLGIEPEALRDVRVPASEALGEGGNMLAAALEDARDPAATLTAWLAARAAGAQRPDALVAAAVAGLRRRDRVAPLSLELGVSERALRRRVTSAVGYGPKRLARVLRLRRALSAARAGEHLAAAAFDAGYADQAHFSGECRELAGVPPSVLLSGARLEARTW